MLNSDLHLLSVLNWCNSDFNYPFMLMYLCTFHSPSPSSIQPEPQQLCTEDNVIPCSQINFTYFCYHFIDQYSSASSVFPKISSDVLAKPSNLKKVFFLLSLLSKTNLFATTAYANGSKALILTKKGSEAFSPTWEAFWHWQVEIASSDHSLHFIWISFHHGACFFLF